jgi:hypothetical protein
VPILEAELGKAGRNEVHIRCTIAEQRHMIKRGACNTRGGAIGTEKYCKWHDLFSHMTNEYNYFHRQIQSVQNDGHLTLEDGQQLKLDANPFLVVMINFEEKKILVHTSQGATTKGKNVIVSDEARARMKTLDS